MTVAEIQLELAKLPQDALVYLDCQHCGHANEIKAVAQVRDSSQPRPAFREVPVSERGWRYVVGRGKVDPEEGKQ